MALIAAVLLFLAFGWHFLDVKDSMAECKDSFLAGKYLFLGAFLFAGCGISFYLMFIRGCSIRLWFAVMAMLIGLGNIYVFKGLSAPDEVSHYITAYKYSNSILLKPAADENGRVYVRACDMYLEDMGGTLKAVSDAEGVGDDDIVLDIFGQTLDENVYRIYEYEDLKTGIGETELSCQWTVNTLPIAYLPQAAGISIARITGLGPLGLITMGKLFNLLFFVGVITLAIGLIPAGGELLAGTAMLPMTMHLAGSMSYDVYVISMSFLFMALVIRLRAEGADADTKKLLGAAVILALLGPCKLVYSLLIFMILMLMPAGRKKFFFTAAMCIVLLGITMYIVNSRTIENYAAADERIITWAEEPEGYTLSLLIHRPIESIRLFYNSFLMQSGNWFSTMFGIRLGNQDAVLNVPYPFIGMYAICLMLLAAGSEIRTAAWEKLLLLCTFLLVLGALMGSMLLAFTPLSSRYIEGVQGRYLLPVLPLLLMSIPGDWISLKRSLGREIIWLFMVMDSYILLRAFATVCLRL